MEAVGTISEGDQWNSLCSDEADFMSQLLGTCSVPNEVPLINGHDFSISNWAAYESNPSIGGVGESSMYSSDDQTSVYSWSSSYNNNNNGGGSSILFPSSTNNQECYYSNNNNNVGHHIFVGNNNLMTMDYCLMMDGKINSSHVMDGGDHDDFLNQDDVSNGSNVEYDDERVVSENVVQRGKETLISEPMKEIKSSNKRPRIPPGEFQRSKRSTKTSKCRKDDSDEDNNNNNNNNNNNSSINNNNNTEKVLHRQSSSGCCSEDDSNGEPSGAGPGSGSKGSGKTRACRGSATDPQSLYARKRRERINERLKILQNLVPNGTKVDISTMLEEAVQYVKFLQLQIKLLSSEDMWMYAPIAYNGMNIGLDNLKIPNVES